ncbi:fimbria/pilus outer membrane usher protein [Novosphingobium sp. Gsoil 351]|uniref:fimbria/pilus outer membrane usher protein n=1 Tax=Novosphingobium sp. Gsoil 351 TaxID=2675225 RepID=UPI0012B4BC1C|nr:fimbria/pilus outer membrane usher protein [Novosphingobium sp. Gsoil 351]QGN54898.1 fimbria/pilus outer membrane usher protein [Novosphingobium sp. Gsoil 351]
MSRLRPFAGERLLALCAAVLAAASGGTPALAQSDPFALPPGLTAQSVAASSGPGLSEISIDGDVRTRLVELAWRDGVLTIDAAAARAAGLPVAAASGGMIPLASLQIAKWIFDPTHQRLDVQLLRKGDGDNYIDLSRPPKRDGISAPLTALRFDYDLTGTLARGRTDAAGLVAAALVRGNVALTSGFQVATSPAPGTGKLLRLDTQLQILLPRRGLTATAGDFFSAGGQSQRALRLGGLQIASDYSLRPDLITTPLPSFTGQVAVPTGIDLINGDQRYKLGDIQPGEFTVRNVPANSGRGEVAVIVRDALGREVIQSTKFYVSRNLLARNLSEFAVNAGFVRRRYGLRGEDYGPLTGSAFYRRGISSRLTVEGTAEWTSGLVNAGARGDVVLGGLALATLEARYSRDSVGKTSGTLLNLGLESSGRRISGRIGAILPSSGYRDVASKLGDPLPPKQFVGQLNFDLGHMNQIQLSASRQERRFDPRFPAFERKSDLLNASFRTRISRSIDVFSSFGYRRGQTSAFTGFAGLSIQLGGGRNFQGSASGGTGAPLSGSSTLSKHDIEGNSVGYAFERTYGPTTRTSGSVAYRSPYGRIEGQAERVGGNFGFRANARGSLLIAGGGVFARNQTGGSYALVRTGTIAGVTVMRENRPAGVTARGGLLLVENIPAQVPISFDIDPDKLPVDALARDTRKRIIVPRGAVGLVALDVVRFIPRQIRLIGPNGQPVAPGTLIKALPSGEQTMAGFDGVVDFNAGGGDRSLAVAGEDGAQCVAEIDRAQLDAATSPDDLPRFECRAAMPGVLAQDTAGERATSGAMLAGRNRR